MCAPLLKVTNSESSSSKTLLMRIVTHEVHKPDGDIMPVIGNSLPVKQVRHPLQIGELWSRRPQFRLNPICRTSPALLTILYRSSRIIGLIVPCNLVTDNAAFKKPPVAGVTAQRYSGLRPEDASTAILSPTGCGFLKPSTHNIPISSNQVTPDADRYCGRLPASDFIIHRLHRNQQSKPRPAASPSARRKPPIPDVSRGEISSLVDHVLHPLQCSITALLNRLAFVG